MDMHTVDAELENCLQVAQIEKWLKNLSIATRSVAEHTWLCQQVTQLFQSHTTAQGQVAVYLEEVAQIKVDLYRIWRRKLVHNADIVREIESIQI